MLYLKQIWGDLLTKVHSYTYYDAVGNPLNNDQRAYQWQHGRQLAKLAVSSEFAIVSHPEDAARFADETAVFTVTAAGTGLSYQWQYKNGENWLDYTGADATTNSISVPAAGNDGTMFRCVVTNAEGALLVSKPATLKHTTIQITSLSPDWWGPETGTAVFTVEAVTTSSSLSYLWKWDNNGSWTNSAAAGATTNTIRVGASGDNWTTYRCYITDAEGNLVISDSVTIHTDPLGFTKQPEDCYCSPSGNATFSVETYGTNLTYQWQWHSPSSTSWSNSAAAGTNTNAISLGVSGDNGTVYRCMITDANGNVAYSEPATVIPYAINWEYQYDADGMRIYRSNGTTTYRYVYNGDQLSQMEITEEATGQKNLLTFSYDANGLPMTVDYNGTTYYYVTNLQGDVIAITDDSGNVKVEYTYDAWGNPLAVSGGMASTLGIHNPLRYRGYVYDSETNLYYLQSRYYDPEIGRFINADGLVSTGQGLSSNNMFAYCGNNPVMRSDPTGQWFGVDDLIAGVVGAVVGVASQLISDVVTSAINGSWQFSNWQTYVGAGIGGAIGGVVTLYAGPIVGAAASAGSSTLIGQTLEKVTKSKQRSAAEIVKNTILDATVGAIVNKIIPIKVSGITSGRNSMSAVFKSGLTKLANKTASKMSIKVIGKGVVSGFMEDLGQTITSVIDNLISGSLQSLDEPLYWCVP